MSTPRRSTRRGRGRTTSDAVEILDALIGDDPKLRAAADRAHEEAIVGLQIHRARAEAGLTQRELADLIGTDQSVISRLEDADYDGHSLSMLRRIAVALGRRIEIRFVDDGEGPRAA